MQDSQEYASSTGRPGRWIVFQERPNRVMAWKDHTDLSMHDLIPDTPRTYSPSYTPQKYVEIISVGESSRTAKASLTAQSAYSIAQSAF